MTVSATKFQTLELDTKYEVRSYRGPYEPKFGDYNCYILNIASENSDKEFGVWATRSLSNYITNQKPNKKFYFSVRENNNIKYPKIEGYRSMNVVTTIL